jgi:hypothetical protein
VEENCPATIENLVNPNRIHLHASVDSVYGTVQLSDTLLGVFVA